MLMQSTRSNGFGNLGRLLRLGLRLESEADLELVLPREARNRRRVPDRFDVERDAVASGFCDRLEVALRLFDHEVAVQPAAEPMDERRDRLEHDRPDRDRRDEVPVADVEMEDPRAGAHQRLDLLTETREVGSVERRLDLHGAHPVPPGHAAILRTEAGDEEPRRPVAVRKRQQEVGPAWVRELRPLGAQRLD